MMEPIITCIAGIITILLCIVSKSIVEKLSSTTKAIDTERLNDELNDIIEKAVNIMNQTHVDSMKSNDTFNEVAQNSVKCLCVDLVIGMMNDEITKYVREKYPDMSMDAIIGSLIENQVNIAKNHFRTYLLTEPAKTTTSKKSTSKKKTTKKEEEPKETTEEIKDGIK